MKKIVIALTLPWLLQAQSIGELFDALKHHSQTKSDEIAVQKSEVQQKLVYANLYPKINLFGSYDNYSSPTNVKPIAPYRIKPMLANPSIAQPYSYNVSRAGANFSMPIFVKSLYTTADKAKVIQKSAKAKKHINLLKNEALIVGTNANYLYLNSLLEALDVKEESLQETKKTTQIKVDNGRAPASALYKIDDALNGVAIAKNNLELQKKKLISTIQTLTGIVLDKPATIQEIGSYTKGKMGALQPLQEKLRADRLGIKAEKEKLYPTLTAHGSYTFLKADAYNNGKNVNEEYGNVGVVLNIPLLAMDNYASIKLAKVKLQASEVELEKLREELKAEADMLEGSLPLLDNSYRLYTQSVADKQKLLDIAKVAYKSGRISTEEYLRYEDALVAKKAEIYKVEATKWQTLMQLAVIYGNNIEEMVK